MSIHRNKQLAEDIARNLRCSGVDGARVVEITVYEVVYERLQAMAAGGL